MNTSNDLLADEGYEKTWEAVADRREAELESGRVAEVPFEEAMQRLRARLARGILRDFKTIVLDMKQTLSNVECAKEIAAFNTGTRTGTGTRFA